jgi:hypothetical protein
MFPYSPAGNPARALRERVLAESRDEGYEKCGLAIRDPSSSHVFSSPRIRLQSSRAGEFDPERGGRLGERFEADHQEAAEADQDIEGAVGGGTYDPGAYHYFQIHDPKERTVAAAPFRDREDLEGWSRRHMRKWSRLRWRNWRGRANAFRRLKVRPCCYRLARISHTLSTATCGEPRFALDRIVPGQYVTTQFGGSRLSENPGCASQEQILAASRDERV